ncbi:GrpB family protein [Gracilibacillus phocaeensis]|uniref:GrpB family protein n=1 Tax=Gracilibacillus phocaeensis TaxID=2042304 RepID=UPI00102F36C6|nr:GrpB family protein [Gracilibacillus phocaeensis]
MTKPTVNLSEYNQEWKIQFAEERKLIVTALGNRVKGIEHIGSTAIKGLKAKPIIDIMVAVEDVNIVSTLIAPLKEIEYQYVPKAELIDRRFFRKEARGQGTCHLHLCEMDRKEWNEKLLFRDYLREHPDAAEKYASLKSQLAVAYKYDRPMYTQQKEPFIKEVIEKAKNEMSQTLAVPR